LSAKFATEAHLILDYVEASFKLVPQRHVRSVRSKIRLELVPQHVQIESNQTLQMWLKGVSFWRQTDLPDATHSKASTWC
jgi:hypothetical protein